MKQKFNSGEFRGFVVEYMMDVVLRLWCDDEFELLSMVVDNEVLKVRYAYCNSGSSISVEGDKELSFKDLLNKFEIAKGKGVNY